MARGCAAVPILAFLTTCPAFADSPQGSPFRIADPAIAPSLGTATETSGALWMLLLACVLALIFGRLLLSNAARETRRLRRLVNATLEAVLVQRNGIVIDANQAACDMFATTLENLCGRQLNELVTPPSRGILRARLDSTAQSRPEVDFEEIDIVRLTGETLPVEFALRLSPDVQGSGLLTLRDVSARRQAEERLRFLSDHDALTGLANRFLFHERLTRAIDLAARKQTEVAVLYLNLDRFRAINEMLGHEAGDQLLVQVAERLESEMRPTDTLARLSSDEFAVLRPLANSADTPATLARALIDGLRMPFQIEGQQVEIGVSIGVATFPAHAQTATRLLNHADAALQIAKRSGRGNFRFFEPTTSGRLQEQRQIRHDLRRALDRGELTLHYQPLVECATGEVKGFEALLRWCHPVHGNISPATFIPIAEESGLILPLGRWVMEAACAEAASWARPCRVAVNLSPAQFRQPDLTVMISNILARTGLPPNLLELEVTEGLLIEEPESVLATLTRLRSLGIRISLDDFGTGYSSLSYLRRFPFDKIKIDRSFVTGIENDDGAAAIVRAIVMLGHSLNLSIVAEGVETQAQFELLRALQCHQVQGFLFGQALARNKLGHLVNPAGEPERPAPWLAAVSAA